MTATNTIITEQLYSIRYFLLLASAIRN